MVVVSVPPSTVEPCPRGNVKDQVCTAREGVCMLTVGQVARAAGVSTKAVRLYEARGLLPVAPRTAGGYRVFTESDVDTVRFIRRARSLGLGLDAAAESWPPTAAEQRPATGPDRTTARSTHRRDRPHTARIAGAARNTAGAARNTDRSTPHRPPHRCRPGRRRGKRRPGRDLPDDPRRHHTRPALGAHTSFRSRGRHATGHAGE